MLNKIAQLLTVAQKVCYCLCYDSGNSNYGTAIRWYYKQEQIFLLEVKLFLTRSKAIQIGF